jgi:hypothetical protein
MLSRAPAAPPAPALQNDRAASSGDTRPAVKYVFPLAAPKGLWNVLLKTVFVGQTQPADKAHAYASVLSPFNGDTVVLGKIGKGTSLADTLLRDRVPGTKILWHAVFLGCARICACKCAVIKSDRQDRTPVVLTL